MGLIPISVIRGFGCDRREQQRLWQEIVDLRAQLQRLERYAPTKPFPTNSTKPVEVKR